MIRIVEVSLITDLGMQTTTVGQNVDIKVRVIENNWENIKLSYTNWLDVRTSFASWQDVKDL